MGRSPAAGMMRRLSDATCARIVAVYRLVARESPSPAIAAALDDIAGAGEPRAIPQLIALTLHARLDVAEHAAAVVQRLRACVDVADWVGFDAAFRGHAPYVDVAAARWAAMQPDELRQVARLAAAPTILQLAMCHPSGFVREEAIRRCATCSDGSEVAVLLLRVNDWVAPVRAAAEAALRARLRMAHAADLVAALPIVEAMRGWGRLRPAVVGDIERVLADPAAVPALLGGTRAADRRVRRAAYRRLLGGPAPAPDVLDAGLRDRDPAIRAAIGRWLVAAPPATFDAYRARLLRSRLGAIRFAAAHRVASSGDALPWEVLLVDEHAGVRGLAQDAALAAGTDPDDAYRRRVAGGAAHVRAIALLGLGETGGARDAAIARAHLRDASATVRAAALRTLARLEADDLDVHALAALDDDRPAVVRIAGRLLAARAGTIGAARLWAAFTAARTPAARVTALGALYQTGFWEGLPHLVRAFDAGDDAVRARVLQHLTRWFARRSRVFVSPPTALATDARAALRASTLPGPLRVRLAWALDAIA